MKRVEYDLNESNYITKIHDYIFYFSSAFNQERFLKGYHAFAIEELNKLKAKYHTNIDIYDYLVLVYYKKIEKRGFKVLTYNTNNDIIELSQDFVFKVS